MVTLRSTHTEAYTTVCWNVTVPDSFIQNRKLENKVLEKNSNTTLNDSNTLKNTLNTD